MKTAKDKAKDYIIKKALKTSIPEYKTNPAYNKKPLPYTNNPAILAMRDIKRFFKKNNIKIKDQYGDTITVYGDSLYNKEQRKLNRDLRMKRNRKLNKK